MKFKIWSDIHSEFFNSAPDDKFKRIFNNYFPIQEDDKNTILLLAGDVGTYRDWDTTYRRIFNKLATRFKKVICVPGNHSWYRSNIWDEEKQFLEKQNIPKKISYIDDGYVMIDKKTIVIGSCLWTDFDNGNPVFMRLAQSRMNDYNYIRKPKEMMMYSNYSSTINAEDVYQRHKQSKQFIIDTLEMAKEKGIKNKIIVTHHAPTYQSVDERYKEDLLNPAYCSSLEGIMLDYDVNLWVHGHQHSSCEYSVGDTRVICNAFGYHGYEVNPKFKHDLVVEI